MEPHKLKKYERGLGLLSSYEKSSAAALTALYTEYDTML